MNIVEDALVTPALFDTNEHTHIGAVYDSQGQLIPSTERGYRKPWRSVDPPEVTRPVTKLEIKSGIYLGHLFPHFGHFLVETLTSLWHGLDRNEPLIFHPWTGATSKTLELPYISQSLEALGISRNRVVVVDQPTRVARLELAPQNHTILGRPLKATLGVYQRLSLALCRDMPDFKARRLYMSRRFYRKSLRAENEAEVEREFARRGFRIVFPEQITFREQVNLVRNAKFLAGIGGSALHLSGFMQPGKKTLLVGSRMLPALYAINDNIGISTTLLSPLLPNPKRSRYQYRVDIDALGDELRKLSLKVKLPVP